MNILIVDDHEQNRYLLESLFKGNGHQVISAPNGKEALEIMKTKEMDLVITDILMPVMDGFQLCRKIKNDPALKITPLIFYTATYTGPQDEAFALKNGAERFIVKPCEPDVLITAVNEVLAAAERGEGAVSVQMIEEEEAYKLYSERLVTKLEQKMLEAEQEIEARKKMETELRQSQAQLLHAQKMESVGRLAGGVAHDYNNMLGIIIGYTQLAMDKTGEADPLYADLQEIYRAAQRSADITRKLLAFARKQTVSPMVLDLNTAVEGMLKMLRHLLQEDLTLSWYPGTGIWPVKIDPSQMDQVLVNLCVNARDAIDGTGEIIIETGNVVFDPDYCALHHGFIPGDFVMLTVSDTGCGMDSTTLDHIFEPFFTTKQVGQGTGLGLAMMYGIMRQNKGFINVYSEPGSGTTFKMYFPRDLTGMDAQTAPDRLKPEPGKGETILVVEDESALLTLTTRLLESLGYKVLSASGPKEALQLAETHTGRIDLLLTDVIMPDMNGSDLANQITAVYPEVKNLFMSGYSSNVIAGQGVPGRGMDFLQKPISIDDLAVKVRQILDRRG